jgi:hypothetical protein
VRAAGKVLSEFKRIGQRGETWAGELALLSDKSIGRNVNGWDEATSANAQEWCRAAKGL